MKVGNNNEGVCVLFKTSLMPALEKKWLNRIKDSQKESR